MLLDRKRIRKWAKWVALFLAIVFVASFLFLGVGYGGAGFNLSSIFTGDNDTPDTPQTYEEKMEAFQATLAQNPKDTAALLGVATLYQQYDDLLNAAAYLERVIAVDPNQKEVYLRLANIYLNANVADSEAAVNVLNKATSVDPQNPDVYLKLGTAQNNLRHTEAAILAWQKYLQLAPNGDMATVVKEQIDKLSKSSSTTTTAGPGTTGGTGAASDGASTTTGGSSSSTATTAAQ